VYKEDRTQNYDPGRKYHNHSPCHIVFCKSTVKVTVKVSAKVAGNGDYSRQCGRGFTGLTDDICLVIVRCIVKCARPDSIPYTRFHYSRAIIRLYKILNITKRVTFIDRSVAHSSLSSILLPGKLSACA